MILDLYRETPGFPFGQYFESTGEFTQAQLYWVAVLRHAVGFEASDWPPRHRPVDLADDMYTGLVINLQNLTQMKEIILSTKSMAGDINMAIAENGPMDAEHLSEELDEATRAQLLAGTSPDQLRADVEKTYQPFMAWVERGEAWIDKPGHPDGGELWPVERLILTAEISEHCEPLALQAIESFIAEGPALERVNTVFAPPE